MVHLIFTKPNSKKEKDFWLMGGDQLACVHMTHFLKTFLPAKFLRSASYSSLTHFERFKQHGCASHQDFVSRPYVEKRHFEWKGGDWDFQCSVAGLFTLLTVWPYETYWLIHTEIVLRVGANWNFSLKSGPKFVAYVLASKECTQLSELYYEYNNIYYVN